MIPDRIFTRPNEDPVDHTATDAYEICAMCGGKGYLGGERATDGAHGCPDCRGERILWL